MNYSAHEIQSAINEAELSIGASTRESELAGTISARSMRILIDAAGFSSELQGAEQRIGILEDKEQELEDRVGGLKTAIKNAVSILDNA